MRSREELRKSLALNMLNKVICVMMAITVPTTVMADPVVGDGLILPPASFTHVQDPALLEKIGLYHSAWCYDDEANALLISAPAHKEAMCELRLSYELEKQKAKNTLRVSNLELRIETMEKEHESILDIKMKEIDALEQIALEKPNNYWYLWAGGGALVGALSTLGIVLMVAQ